MRVALTGAATGIGAEIAKKLKARGDTVVAFDIQRPENVDHWFELDLSDQDAIMKTLVEVKGPFDALINNAGLPPRDGLEEKILGVNVFGVRTLTEGLLDKLSPGSAIVTTASRAGFQWAQNIEQSKELLNLASADDLKGFIEKHSMDATRAYNLSKEAVIVWTLSMTEKLIGKQLRANTVSPAAVQTAILGDFRAAFGARVDAAAQRVGGVGSASEIAELVIFLASPESSWIKGQDITIDGGISALMTADHFSL